MNSLKKNQIEILFKSVVECGKGFKDYNFRNYIVRRAAEVLIFYLNCNKPFLINHNFRISKKYKLITMNKQ
jgi:hypothetical protein